MGSVNISIKKEAYDFLNQFKKDEMSYSDVILSFKKKDDSVMRLFGSLKDVDWESRKKGMDSFRGSFNKRLR
jgi:predicted CopG family antitoxin